MFTGLKEKLTIKCAIEWCGETFIRKTPWHNCCSTKHQHEYYLIREANKVMKKAGR